MGQHNRSLTALPRGCLSSDRTIQLNPDYAQAYYHKGQALYDLSRYEESIAAYEQTTRLDPHFVVAYTQKSFTLLELGRHNEALEICSRAIRLNPNKVDPYCKRQEASGSSSK
jgi:tetratricopeptide (TPR) repeat protein